MPLPFQFKQHLPHLWSLTSACLGLFMMVSVSAQEINDDAPKAPLVDMPWQSLPDPSSQTSSLPNAPSKIVAPIVVGDTDENLVKGALAYERQQINELKIRYSQEKNPQAKELLMLWQTLLQLTTLPAKTINLTINRFQEPLWSMRLRRDWIIEASRQGLWQEVNHWKNGLDSPTIHHQCAFILADIMLKPELTNQILKEKALPLWQSFTKPLGSNYSPCHLLQENLFRTTLITPLEISRQWRRLLFTQSKTELLGGAFKNTDIVLSGLLNIGNMPLPNTFTPKDFFNKPEDLEKQTLKIINTWNSIDPQLNKQGTTYQEWLVAVLVKISGQDPELASNVYQRVAQWLSPSAQATAHTYIALGLGKKLSPQTRSWLTMAQFSELWSSQQEILLRSYLRDRLWDSLRRRIDQATPELQQSATWRYWWARSLIANNSVASNILQSALMVDITSANIQDQPLAFAAHTLNAISQEPNFYGALASEALGKKISIPPFSAPANASEIQAAETNECLAWSSRLIKLGGTVRLFGVAKWRQCLVGMSDRQLLAVSVVAANRGILDRAVNTAILTQQDHDWRLRFITPFADIVKPYASRHNLSWAWVYGLIRQESRFLMDANSSAGARGLMQIMPKTGVWLAKKVGMKSFTIDQLNDININVQLGVSYMEQLFERFSHPLLVTAAYNAGPSRAQRWRPTAGSIEAAIYAETIPFNETRDYVKNVLWNATIYQVINGQGDAKISEWLAPIQADATLTIDLP